MKKLFAMLTVVATSFATVQAASLLKPDFAKAVITLEKKVKIAPEELPAPVKTAIEENFADWDISAAYLLTESKQYEVEFQQEGQTQTVKFDKNGNVIR